PSNELRRLFNETKQAIDYISRCTSINQAELQSILLTADEEELILTVNSTDPIGLIKAVTLLRDLQARFLRKFVLSAFDLTRYMTKTPKRIQYAKHKELELYNSMMSMANLKQDEMRAMIQDAIHEIRNRVLERNIMTNDIEQFVLSQLNSAIADKLVGSVDSLRSSYVGTLERCLASLEHNFQMNNEPASASLALSQILTAAYRVEVSVKDSTSVLRLFWEKIKQLVLGSLTWTTATMGYGHTTTTTTGVGHGHNNNNTSSNSNNSRQQQQQAGSQSTPPSSASNSQSSDRHQHSNSTNASQQSYNNNYSCNHHNHSSSGNNVDNEQWQRRQQALHIIDNISESKLAKSICQQFRERLRSSHEQFILSIKELEAQHAGRLQHTEELRSMVRKMHAPPMAKYFLESTSLIDLLLHGMPCLEKEIGRGQYGVVYGCDSWAGFSPCAVKSVVPPDDKHWYDLGMEYYFAKSIPKHDRVVRIHGSVIDHSYGAGTTPAVLLIMERLSRDLYSAIKCGLDWLSRLQVAIDVVQGLRFLHGQALCHRDIKASIHSRIPFMTLKNVLLDSNNRAKITDLGFCKPEAMMSGSIVGTPIHMSPELFSGCYDNSVDVYAFGILFWYICAGHVRLPHIFEQCQTRDQLWNCVRRGVRPERLPQFDNECWTLMVQCWDGDRFKRPHPGDVELRLRTIYNRYAGPQANNNKQQ
ncbi:Dual serine/threonine and tyrosine protein kinase, partial [Fragariocoptes setiger]